MRLERTVTRLLAAVRLHEIKRKIIAFAVLATLVPSLSMGWLSYHNNRRALSEKLAQELNRLTGSASQSIDLWLKERRYEIRVFSSSYEVSENLATIVSQSSRVGREVAHRRLRDYLESVGDRFVDYEELVVLDAEGQLVASNSPASSAALSGPWLERVQRGEPALSAPHLDPAHGAVVVIAAQPVRSLGEEIIGTLAAKIALDQVGGLLAQSARSFDGEVYLVDRGGSVLASSRELEAAVGEVGLGEATVRDLHVRGGRPATFESFRGVEVVGCLERLETEDWGVVAETSEARAYATIRRVRNATLGLVALMLLGVGLAAYILGLTIVNPLDRLTAAASRVGKGDLAVDLPVFARNEVGYLTRVFNDMVARLRTAQEELAGTNQQLRQKNRELREVSITDGLTGLFNRTYLHEVLDRELLRASRHGEAFAVLMIDIDHFKEFNDSFGHQAGDDALVGVAGVFTRSIRRNDYSARYGGEEFLLLLTQTGIEQGSATAEKIRKQVEEQLADGPRPVTVSIGVASYPESGDSVADLVREADRALYRAKREGRNRVVVAGTLAEA